MKLEISRREPAFEGMTFGGVGAYEKITGRAHGDVDPAHPLNADIVNLDKAPRNADGRVEYWVDFCLLKPTDMTKGNRRLLCDIVNRGNKLALIDLNDTHLGPTSNDPATIADAGNGFLMRQGYAILFLAWQGDVAPEGDALLAAFPVATNDGEPIVETAREEVIFGHTDSPATAPLTYPAHDLDPAAATLTVRLFETDERVTVQSDRWRYLSPSQIEIDLVEGFDAGALYEFIYPARDPIVMGLGFAAVRDVTSFMRFGLTDNPLNPDRRGPAIPDGRGPAIDFALAYGRSQPGRFLREYVRLGFNQELGEGRKVFDGIYTAIAGSRRIFLNQPFSQPGRFHRQQEDRLFPGDQFPFTYGTCSDSISGKTGGILERSLASGTCPKIVHIDSSTEFWQGRASLLVADGDGNDIPLPDEVRLYLFSGTGHAGSTMIEHAPMFSQDSAYELNLLDYRPLNRSLLVALDQWATEDIAPPGSRYPRVGDRTLVPPLPQSDYGFPDIPDVTYAGLINGLSAMDYSRQPPQPVPGRDYSLLVPKVDADGNEVAGIRLPDIAVPLGTRTGWNPRGPGFSEGVLMIVGAYFPFAADADARRATGDPRPSVDERYPSRQHYIDAIEQAAIRLQEERLLLAEDVERCVAAAAELKGAA